MSSLKTAAFRSSKIKCVLWVLFVAIVFLGQTSCPAAAVVINEVMASNNSFTPDPQNQYEDWIELYNPGTATVDVAGMYVTDDLGEPTKWRFPSGRPELTRIAPGGFLVLWADGDVADSGLHAGFSLSGDGEEVGLFDSDGITLLDSVSLGPQRVDLSYGRYPDGSADWQFMVWPTPEDKNVSTHEGVVAEPQFSHVRGFYDETLTLELTTTPPDATIYYRLDGGDPMVQSGRVPIGTRYTGPITVTRTTCVRAGATKTGWLPSATVTATYLFLDDVIRQSASPTGFPATWGGRGADYAMDQRVVDDPKYRDEIKEDLRSTPSICISIGNSDFFTGNGIYANPTLTGPTSERAASIEWIDPSTGEHFGVNAGLRIHGGPYSRSQNPKNAFRLNFRAEYGLSQLKYPLFPDTEVDTFDTLALRSIWNYSWSGHSGMSGSRHADYLRDVFARDTVRDMGRLTPHGRPIQVYINGLYWGLYIMTERPTEDFAADYLGGDEENYDILEAPSGMGASTTMDVVAGGPEGQQAWNALFTPSGDDLVASQAYDAFQALIDVPTMIDYMLMVYYTGSRDAPVFLGDSSTPRNFYVIRRRDPASPFVIVPWDVEWCLEEPTVNRVGVVGVMNPHVLMDRLANNADFSMLLADRIYRHFYNGGVLTRESATARYMARADEIRGAIVGESARWGDEPRPSQPYTREDWETEVNRLVNQYFSNRTQTVLNQLRNRKWYPSVSPPDFLVNGQPQHGGNIDIGQAITLTNAGPALWYTLDGSDPRVPGAAASADQSLVWVPENAAKKVLVPAGPVDDAWRGAADFDDSAWISGSGGVGLERSSGFESYFNVNLVSQMYGKNATCYIRIPFTLSAQDLANVSSLLLRVRYDDGFIAWLNGVEVQRAQFNGAPAWNSMAISNHPDDDAVNLQSFDISAHLDKLRTGRNILAIQGLNAGPSSSDFLISAELAASQGEPTGVPTGVSTTAIRYQGPITLDASAEIKVRTLSGSTWSALNEAVFAVGPVAQSLRISELMYHPANTGDPNDPNAEYIELTNIGAQTINLNLVQFTNGVDFTFPSFALASGKYCLVVRDLAAFEAVYSDNLPVAGQYEGNLRNSGERIELQDAAGAAVCNFRFADDWFTTTDGGGYSLVVKDPRTTDPNALEDKNVWRPSKKKGGSPGTSD